MSLTGIFLAPSKQNQLKKAQKMIAEQNIKNAVKVATEMAEVAASDGKAYCVSQVDVGLDAAAVREAVLKITGMVSSTISLSLWPLVRTDRCHNITEKPITMA